MTGVVLKMEGWRHGSVVVHVGEHTVAHVCALIKLHLNYGHLLWEGGREEGREEGREGERKEGTFGFTCTCSTNEAGVLLLTLNKPIEP